MSLSLDSNVVIDVMRGRKAAVIERFDAARAEGARLSICSVALQELAYGCMRSVAPARNLNLLDAVVSVLDVESWTADDAMVTARLRADLAIRGAPIGAMDTLIAGHALSRGYTLVTGNVREFTRVPGLSVIDWTISDKPLDYAEPLARFRGAPDEER